MNRIDITDEMKAKALKFAVDIVRSDNQFSRLLPPVVRNSNDLTAQQSVEIQRTYLGKLGELAFLKFLRQKGQNS